ncbi:MAG: DegV family protein [Halanaerobiales bacterium]|nr:DegV family protein [Halanaerobiales bacterium]
MEEKIAIVTDSASDLSKEILEKRHIEFLPLKIIFSDGQYEDRVDIEPNEVYERLSSEIPSTSMPTRGEIHSKYLKLKEHGFTHIISIHISSGLSGTYENCKMASQNIEGIEIELIDSKLLSMGLGRLVLYAKDLVEEGKSNFSDIVDKIKDKKNKIDLYFIVDTLKYLKEGGRIGKISGTIAEFLDIKPIISIDEEGQYYTFDKVRTKKKAIKKLLKLTQEKASRALSHIDIMHADAEEEALKIYKKVKTFENVKESIFGEISPAMVVHSGPGLIGVCITKV